MTLAVTEIALIDRWQRDFPLTERPFAVVGRPFGLDEATTVQTLARLAATGVISRIGAIVRPHTVGASTLAAIRVPPDRLAEVAAAVSHEPMVSHNYEREHGFNLWFVITAPDHGGVARTVAAIERKVGLDVMELPLIRGYHLDLGFSLGGARLPRGGVDPEPPDYRVDPRDRSVLAAIEDGLPLTERPFAEIAARVGLAEDDVIRRLRHLVEARIVTRFGCIVRHRALGYTSNAMCVWDVPDGIVDRVAQSFVTNPSVTLCYQRPRRLPDWPYNLFCMVHAKSRDEALATLDDLNAVAETSLFPQTVLFSTRCFKQRGAVFSDRARELVA